MNRKQASQIADLLKQNDLVVTYTTDRILKVSQNYVFIEEDKKIMACAELKKVQWYQWEVSHVSVAKLRGGYGTKIINLVEQQAIENNARVLQCTIRADNIASIGLFKSLGYMQGTTFFYPKSGNDVLIFQKALSVCSKSE
ncbi:MAG: GNAT family N-acetyltransferase [Bacteroidia bacterium]